MTVNKITTPPTPQAQIDKINEIIDNLGGGGGGGLAYSATCPAITITDGVATWTVTHNLGTQSVVATLYNVSTGAEIEKNIIVTSNNTLTVAWKASSNVTSGAYKIVVLASGATAETNLWVSSVVGFYSGQTLNGGNPNVYSIDLSTYLPNDGAQYEVIFLISQSEGNVVINSDFSQAFGGMYGECRESAMFVIGSGRYIELNVYQTSRDVYINAACYRKVG